MTQHGSGQEAAAAVAASPIADAAAIFSWGSARAGRSRRRALGAEFAGLFLLMPALAAAFPGTWTAPIFLGSMIWASVILLSLSRNFLWADLLPRDVLSEWPLFAAITAGFAGLALGAGYLVAPESMFAPEEGALLRLALYPLLVALPLELCCRALFFRRYGPLLGSERAAVLVSGLVGAAIWFAIGCSCGFAAFGALTGAALSWAYLRTGQFALSVALNWAAALSLYLIAPGLTGI